MPQVPSSEGSFVCVRVTENQAESHFQKADMETFKTIAVHDPGKLSIL